MLNNGAPLKSRLGVIRGHSKWYHSISPSREMVRVKSISWRQFSN